MAKRKKRRQQAARQAAQQADQTAPEPEAQQPDPEPAPAANAKPSFFKDFLLPPVSEEGAVWKHLWTWLGIAFALRAGVALGGDFLLHPDEIMQYLEPAHKAVFGYGVSYWEYYYGARSFLIPGFVAAFLWLCKITGLDHPGFYVYAVKVVFCALAVLIPWACYHIGRRLFNEDCGRLALILAALWPYLIVFAHKPFTEFTAAPVFFAAFALACRPAADRAYGAIGIGLLLALTAALRMQYLPTAGLLWLALALARPWRWTLLSAGAGIVMLALVGLYEALTWSYPYQSYYVNFLANQFIAENRPAEPLSFFIERLPVTTGLLFPAAIYMAFKNWRACALLLLLLVGTLLLHNIQVHKEMRFIFIIHAMLLLLIAAGMVHWLSDLKLPALRLAVPGAYAGVFAIIICFNIYDDSWLHTANSRERGETLYLTDTSNLYRTYLKLHDDPDLRGVAHVDDAYFNTPGYYFLHRPVPFYDGGSIGSALQQVPAQDMQAVVSHVVTRQLLRQVPGFTQQPIDGDYLVYVSDSDEPVRQLEDLNPYIASAGMHQAFVLRGITELPMPPPFPQLVLDEQ